MERPSRALRRLPGRLADEAAPPARKKSASPRKIASKKSASPARKPVKERTPPRRSRSRSTGRKKTAVNRIEEKKVSPQKSEVKKKSATPPRSGIVSRVKESVEKFKKSLSPDVESLIRRSVSRFEEVTNEVRRSVTPRPTTTTTGLNISTRSSLRVKSKSILNNIEKLQDVEFTEEKIVKNHVRGVEEERKHDPEWKWRAVHSFFLVTSILALTITTVAAHVVCTRDDCRVVVPSPTKFINYKIYFDRHVWPAFTVALIACFASTRFIQFRIKKAPFISLLGIGWLLIIIGSLGACHYYFSGLSHLKFLPFVTASLFHALILTTLFTNSNSLLGVKIPSFLYKLSALISLIVSGWVVAAETSRTTPNLTVYVLAGLQAWQAADSLVFEPLINTSSPLFILLLVIRPFIYALFPIYISANNINVHVGILVGVGLLQLVGYFLYRYSLFTKGRFLSDPYSYRHIKLGYGEYSEGPWKVVRYPDILGRLLAELGLALSIAPSLISPSLAILAILNAVLEARHLSLLSPDQSSVRIPRKTLIPYVY